MACELHDLETGKAVQAKKTATDWITGEVDVTLVGTRPDRTSDDAVDRARMDALHRAKRQLMKRYRCVGTCEREGDFCVLDVRVVEGRSGALVRRMVANDPLGFPYQRLGQTHSEHVFLTYDVKVSCFCRCGRRSPVTSGGTGVEGLGSVSGGDGPRSAEEELPVPTEPPPPESMRRIGPGL